jgi:hypothetical protein
MPKKRKAKMGRPPLPPGVGKTVMLRVRVTESEFAKLKADAAQRGISMSDVLMAKFREG